MQISDEDMTGLVVLDPGVSQNPAADGIPRANLSGSISSGLHALTGGQTAQNGGHSFGVNPDPPTAVVIGGTPPADALVTTRRHPPPVALRIHTPPAYGRAWSTTPRTRPAELRRVADNCRQEYQTLQHEHEQLLQANARQRKAESAIADGASELWRYREALFRENDVLATKREAQTSQAEYYLQLRNSELSHGMRGMQEEEQRLKAAASLLTSRVTSEQRASAERLGATESYANSEYRALQTECAQMRAAEAALGAELRQERQWAASQQQAQQESAAQLGSEASRTNAECQSLRTECQTMRAAEASLDAKLRQEVFTATAQHQADVRGQQAVHNDARAKYRDELHLRDSRYLEECAAYRQQEELTCTLTTSNIEKGQEMLQLRGEVARLEATRHQLETDVATFRGTATTCQNELAEYLEQQQGWGDDDWEQDGWDRCAGGDTFPTTNVTATGPSLPDPHATGPSLPNTYVTGPSLFDQHATGPSPSGQPATGPSPSGQHATGSSQPGHSHVSHPTDAPPTTPSPPPVVHFGPSSSSPALELSVQGLVLATHAMISTRGSASTDVTSQLLQQLADKANEDKLKLGTEKPKLTATTADGCRDELKAFKTLLVQAGIEQRSKWVKAARAVATGRAKIALDSVIASEVGPVETYVAKLRDDPGSELWGRVWDLFETRIRGTVHLNEDTDLNHAIAKYGELRLQKGADASATQSFIEAYTSARTLMLEQGLVSNTDHVKIVREVTDFKQKIAGTAVYTYLHDLPELPRKVDSNDPDEVTPDQPVA